MTENDDASPAIRPPHLDHDTLVELLSGLRTGAARNRALAHLRACPECEARFRETGGDLERIRTRPAPAGWAAPPVPASGARPTPLTLVQGMAQRFVLPLAAAAALFIGARLWLLRQSPPTEPGYWMPLTGELQQLRDAGGAESDSLFWRGLAAYEAHDAARAREDFLASRTSGGYDDLRRLYLASALLNAGRVADALREIDRLGLATLPMPWREDATWIRYRALRDLGRPEAGTLLNTMAAWPGRVGELARAERATGR